MKDGRQIERREEENRGKGREEKRIEEMEKEEWL